ncbi:MAG TPA: sulfonate ABC transporter substrate-binding protein [Propionibacteriaceae bacterium]|nr:sulfonate ABC transporter substrate-binding protein [Propionibacteriaceae bacterium]
MEPSMTHDPTPVLGRRSLFGAAALGIGGLLVGCSSGPTVDAGPVRIGYFPNITHAPGLIADAAGFFGTRLAAANATPVTSSFNAGPQVLQAILSGSLDISYIGPNPTVTAYARSRSTGIRVISGSTSGGSALVVRAGITTPAQLKGRRFASPQLGNTQDVAFRSWLHTQGLTASQDGGGDVSILPQANSAAVQAFKTGNIDGGWVPEPYWSSLVKAGGHVLVDERTLWPGGRFVTTNVIVRTEFLTKRPLAVQAFLEAHLDALDLCAADAGKARGFAASQIKKITSQTPDAGSLAAAWGNLAFTADPLAATLRQSAANADSVGLLVAKPTDDFASLWQLDPLNAVLLARGQKAVAA